MFDTLFAGPSVAGPSVASPSISNTTKTKKEKKLKEEEEEDTWVLIRYFCVRRLKFSGSFVFCLHSLLTLSGSVEI